MTSSPVLSSIAGESLPAGFHSVAEVRATVGGFQCDIYNVGTQMPVIVRFGSTPAAVALVAAETESTAVHVEVAADLTFLSGALSFHLRTSVLARRSSAA